MHRRYKKIGNPKSTKNKFEFKKICFIILSCLITYIVINIFCAIDKKIFDEAVSQSKFIINNKINLAIYNCVEEIIKKNHLTSNDFCYIDSNSGKINSVCANTILINKFCSQLSVAIPEQFDKLHPKKIKIPVGSALASLTNINLFSSIGPNISVGLVPMGDIIIDYESKFQTAGINQTYLQILLNINFDLQLVNPLHKKHFTFNKKIPLVNTVINGTVPNTYVGRRIY